MGLSKKFLVAFAFVLALVYAPTTAFAQDPDNGKVIYEEQVWQCAACHGAEGEGMWGRPLTNSSATAEEWVEQVRNPRRFMPAFSEAQVTDEQITDMHAYLTSLTPATDFQRADAGLPEDAHPGQLLMAQKSCIACHGDTGPLMGFIDRGETPTAEGVIAQLRTPFNNMPSYSEAQVSDEEATLMAEFMAEQVTAASAPEALPESGHHQGVNLALIVFLLGGMLILGGLALSRYGMSKS